MNAQRALGRKGTIWIRAVAIIAVVALALAVRLPRLNVFITPDEMKWLCRSVNFYRGLSSGDLARTVQTGHPGVITMWLGAPFSGADIMAPELDACINPKIADILQESAPETPEQYASYLYGARRGVVLWTALMLGLAVWLLAELVGWPAALVTGALIALDPFYTAHSRVLHLDAIETSLLFPAMLALTTGLRTRRKGRLVLAGVFMALAALNKSPAFFGLGFAGLATLLWGAVQRWPFRRIVVAGLWWGLPALGVYAALWPAMWVQPVVTLKTVFDTAFFYASQPHVNSNFFMGAPRPDPGPAFYPVALAFRLTPWTSIGAALGLGWWLAGVRRRDGRLSALALPLGLALAYGLMLTVGQKKFDRYLLPAFPVMDLLAGVGLTAAIGWLVKRLTPAGRRTPGWLGGSIAGVLALGLGLTTLTEAPYYLTYYNPLVGGKQAAVKTLLVGWGEGLDVAAAAMNTLPGVAERTAVTRAMPGFAPYFVGRAIPQDSYDPATSDYVVFYLNEVQRRLDDSLMAQYYDSQEPLMVIRVKGIDYAWIYENSTNGLPQQYIAEHAGPDDALVIAQPSIWSQTYAGALPMWTIPRKATRAEAQAILEEASRNAEHVWYVRYAEKNRNALLEWVDLQWRTHAPQLAVQELTDISVTLWDVSSAPSFTAPETQTLPIQARFGQDLELTGVTLGPLPPDWARSLGVTLHWRPLKDGSSYLACYVHVYDESGQRVGQGDLWLVDESLHPTVAWKRDQAVATEIPITLMPGLSPGRYQLVAGVYDRISDQPLPPEGGTLAGDRGVLLGELEVTPTTRAWEPKQAGLQDMDEPTLGGLTLRGLHLSTDAPAFGDTLGVALAWQAVASPRADYAMVVTLLDEDGRPLDKNECILGSLGHPTSQWQPGEMYWRNMKLTIPASARAGRATLSVALMNVQTGTLTAAAPVAELDVRGHLYTPPAMAHTQSARLGERIALLGYALEPESGLEAGQALQLTLYWQALDPVAGRYKVFTHLLDSGGAVRAQMDSEPLAGRYPTSNWQAGEVIVDTYRLELATDASPGAYRLEVGMYDPDAEAQRIPVYGPDGARLEQDRILLDQTVTVGQ